MRNSLSLFLAMCFTVLSWTTVAAEGAHKEGYSFKNGKVVMMKEGKETVVTAEVTLHSGARLLPEGIIVTKEGKRERFPEGRWLTLEGEFVVVDAGGPDVVVVDDFDGYYLEDGRVYVIRDSRPVLVTVEISLSNGLRLSPDGTIISKEGTRSRLVEGQGISKAGKIVEHKSKAPARAGETREKPIDTSRNPEEAVKKRQEEKEKAQTPEKDKKQDNK